MKNKCNLKGNQISQIISDVLEGLIYLQENSIMHRDLKPENILLREKDMKWVLIDFGLAAFTN
jgi:serine/threonine protein kinase